MAIRTPTIADALPRLALSALMIVGCGDPRPGATSPEIDGAPGSILVQDGGFRTSDFACPDGSMGVDPFDADSDGSEAASCVAANPKVRFSVDVAPIWGSCSGELCHDVWKYATTVGVASLECCDRRKLVEPGQPARSYLLQKMRGIDLCGRSSEMPPGVMVSQEVIDVIASWICIGAPDD